MMPHKKLSEMGYINEFNKQLDNNLKNDIDEFNSKSAYVGIRKLYKNNFDQILGFILKTNSKLAIEDIAKLDSNLTHAIFGNALLLQQINRAISEKKLTRNNIK